MPALTRKEREDYAKAITEMAEERTEHEGEEHGDYADARRHYIYDATDEEILGDFAQEKQWEAARASQARSTQRIEPTREQQPVKRVAWPFPVKK